MNKQIQITIYLKNKRRPIASLIVSNDTQVEKFIDKLNSGIGVVQFYNVVFNVSSFNYAIVKEI